MSVTIDQLVQGIFSSTSSPYSFNAAVTAGGSNRYMAVFISVSGGGVNTPTISGVTCVKGGSATAMTLLDSVNNATDFVEAAAFGLANPDTGTPQIVITMSDGNNYSVVAEAISLTIVDQTVPVVAGHTNHATGNNSTPTLTLISATGELALDVISEIDPDTTGNTIPTGGQTKQWYGTNTTGASMGGAGSSEAGASSLTMSWDIANIRNWAEVAISLAPAAAGGAAQPKPWQLQGGQAAILAQ